MDARGVAWLSYLPLPGIALVPALLHPRDRLARYHAWQGTVLAVGLLAALAAVGLVGLALGSRGARSALGLLSGALLAAAALQMALGAVGAARGRYPRLRPAWDVAAALRRGG